MKRFAFAILALICIPLLSAQTPEYKDWANFGKYAAANQAVEKPVSVVFMGNSITEGWWNTHADFFTANGYVNRGISGQVTAQMLVRFRPDVIELQPKVVVILAGTNDIAQNDYAVPLQNTLHNIASMAELAQANHIRVVLCSLLPATSFPWRPSVKPATQVAALNDMIQEYAQKHGIIYVDYYSALVDSEGGLPLTLAPDGIHPNTSGYQIMEPLVQAAIRKALQ